VRRWGPSQGHLRLGGDFWGIRGPNDLDSSPSAVGKQDLAQLVKPYHAKPKCAD